jgi:hypothetical protein
MFFATVLFIKIATAKRNKLKFYDSERGALFRAFADDFGL